MYIFVNIILKINILESQKFSSRFFWLNSPQWARFSSITRFQDHTQRSNTAGRISLDE